jgi:hypothetical protein
VADVGEVAHRHHDLRNDDLGSMLLFWKHFCRKIGGKNRTNYVHTYSQLNTEFKK